jgi:hypothetical protein
MVVCGRWHGQHGQKMSSRGGGAGNPVTLTARLTLKGEHVATLEEWIGQELQRSHGRVKDERILFSGNATRRRACRAAPGGQWVVQQKRSRLSARLSARMHALRFDARAFAASMHDSLPWGRDGLAAPTCARRMSGGGRSTVPRHTRITGRREMVGRPQHQTKQNKKLNQAPENGQKTHRFVCCCWCGCGCGCG